MTKKYQICRHQIRFFKLKMQQNSFSAAGRAYDAPPPPDPLVSWAPRSTPSASRTRRLRSLGSQTLLNTKSMATSVEPMCCRILTYRLMS